ncbi:hypothetical protein AAEO56_00075 [Flavobacterium sp. DGU11]|uniref:Uncharacterized protein n=1 Tax=Flavobacterium arundinis TaxID=3139143 RepID=A0ABU9HR46_9FLAO
MVRKVPGLDPDISLVKLLVDNFITKASDITDKLNKENSQVQKTEKPDENSVAKLFEEVKIMFDNLPNRIENRIDPDLRRKKKRFHPMLFEELLHYGIINENPYFGLSLFLSFYKDDFPWFYEIGLETIRDLKKVKTHSERLKLIHNLEWAIEMIGHPMIREFYGDREDIYLLKESRHVLIKLLDRLGELKN